MPRGEQTRRKPVHPRTRWQRIGAAGTALSWLYAAGIALWFVLQRQVGDAAWWLALLNALVPYLFLPLVVLLPAALAWRQRPFGMSVALPALVFVALYGHLYLPARPVAHATIEAPLTVMSFNIWGGSQAPETARVILDHGAPDVVALQELTPHMAEVLQAELGDVYPYRAIEARGQYHGLGVLSRYPLAELDISHLLHPDWRIQALRVEARGGAFTLYNVHPYSTNVIFYLESGAPIAEQVRASVRTRQDLIRRLAADVTGRAGPVVVAGDLNCTDQSKAYAILADHLADVHRAVGWGFGHTFPAYAGRYRGIPVLPRQMRIDMIFASEELVPLRSRVGETHGESDHLPVLAELGWR